MNTYLLITSVYLLVTILILVIHRKSTNKLKLRIQQLEQKNTIE